MYNSIITFFNETFDTHFKHKRKKKYSARTHYLRLVGTFLSVIAGLFIYARLSTKTTVAYQNNSNPAVTSTSKMEKISTKYNPKTGLMVSQFYIGNPKKVGDISDDSNLTNLKYSVKYKSVKGDYKHLKTRLIRINDHYFAIETHNIEPGFLVFRYDITPKKINKTLSTSYNAHNTINFYVNEKDVKKATALLPASKDMYRVDYTSFVVHKYQHAINELSKDINSAKKAKKADKKLIEKLQTKLEAAVPSDQEDLQSQIDETKTDIHEQNQLISQSKHKIKRYEERISNVQDNNVDDD